MRRKEKQHTIDILFVLVLFCVLALTSLLVVYIGSRVYSSSTETMDINFHNHVATDYIIKKVQQTDGTVQVSKMDDIDVLCLEELIDGKPYITYIYCYEGQLKEICIRKGDNFRLGEGESIMEADKLKMKRQENVLDVYLMIEEKYHDVQISLQKGKISHEAPK